MTLESKVLKSLAEWRTDSASGSITDETAGWCVDLNVDRADVVGMRLNEVVLRPTSVREGDLKEHAGRIAAGVTGLMERLALIEIDEDKRTAMLRSEQPVRREDELFYYEVLADATGVMTLRRYQTSVTPAKRQQVPFALTHEALARVAAELASAW
jgi:hypothetical protein